MKTPAIIAINILMTMQTFAGESSLTKTFQPLDGLSSGEILITEVTCHDSYSHSGQPTAIGLISAKNTPPTNSDKATENLNLASASNLHFSSEDIEAIAPRLIMNADKFLAARGYPKEAILKTSLECLRRVLPAKLLKTEMTFTSSSEDHEWIARIVSEFNQSDRSKPFYKAR